MSYIYGTKTQLRRFEDRMSDAEIARLYEWSRDPELLRWSGGTPTELSQDEFREHVRGERLYGPTNRRMYLVFAREDMALIGRIGVFAIDWNKRDAELGIVIGERAYWNRGYGRDAVQALLQHLFTSSSLGTIYLYTFADNIRAQHSFAAVGFRVSERGPRFTPDVGEFDSVRMEITRQEFLQRHPPKIEQPTSPHSH
ncbi:MAG TPA: GNAT family N-acetyltransferase [Anaerolineae bacterium]|nr:GNAT family N-acetyltransferase [Anaerolineae bacterium]